MLHVLSIIILYWQLHTYQLSCNAHTADCGLPLVNKNIKLNYNSTLEGSRLTLTCENDNNIIITSNINASTTILNVTCHSDGNWVPNPANFIESCLTITTAPPSGIKIALSAYNINRDSKPLICYNQECCKTCSYTISRCNNIIQIKHRYYRLQILEYLWSTILKNEKYSFSSDAETLLWPLITIAVCAVSSLVFLSIGYACGWFSHKHKQSRTRKAEDDEKNNEGSQLSQPPGPLYYEEVELQQRSTPEHQDLVELKENVAYGPIIK